MLKNKKANFKGEKNSNKIIKNIGEENSKKKKHQLEKVKNSVKAGLVKTTPEVLTKVGEIPMKKKGGKKPQAKNVVLEDIEQSEDETEQEDSEQSEEEQSEVETDEEDAEQEAMEQSDVETDEEDAEQSEAKIDEEDSKTSECAEGTGQTLFVDNIQINTHRAQLVELFAPYGKVMAILFKSFFKVFFAKTINKPGTKAFVVLDSVEAADKAQSLNGTLLNGAPLLVTKFKEAVFEPNIKKVVLNSTNTVFVSNLDKATTSESLKRSFSKCGKIEYVKLLAKKEVLKPGRAFVCFKSPAAVELALELNSTMLDERPIRVVRYLNTKRPQLKNLDKDELKKRMLAIGKKVIKNANKKPAQFKKKMSYKEV